MVSIITAASEDAKARAIEKGYHERICLVKFETGSSDELKIELTREALREIRPHQVYIGDYWGACPD